MDTNTDQWFNNHRAARTNTERGSGAKKPEAFTVRKVSCDVYAKGSCAILLDTDGLYEIYFVRKRDSSVAIELSRTCAKDRVEEFLPFDSLIQVASITQNKSAYD